MICLHLSRCDVCKAGIQMSLHYLCNYSSLILGLIVLYHFYASDLFNLSLLEFLCCFHSSGCCFSDTRPKIILQGAADSFISIPPI